MESEDQSELCWFLVSVPVLEKPTLFKGKRWDLLLFGGISSNQNAVISEDERPLYTGFNYSMNFRGNYNYYKKPF